MSAGTNRIITPLIAAFVLLTSIPTFAGKIIYVDDDGPADFNNIQAAINYSSHGDTIIVAEGRYFENINFNGRNITLTSTDPCNPDVVAATIIDGSQNGSVVTFHSGEDANCVLNGFTITNGNAESGGGIYCVLPFSPHPPPPPPKPVFHGPMIKNCIISNNSAIKGGGMLNRESSPTLKNCLFSVNSAGLGGGICNEGFFMREMNPILTNCIFSGNSATAGGGMFNFESNPTLTNCTFNENSASGYGGGMENGGSSPSLTNCIFTNNSAEFGGGISNILVIRESRPILTNCTFSGNSARRRGGGMFNVGPPGSEIKIGPTLINCTFTGNLALGDHIASGGGMYNDEGHYTTVINCIFWNNVSYGISGSSVDVTYSDIEGGWSGQGNIDTDPCFVSPGYWADTNDPNISAEPNDPNAVWIDGDYHLIPGSPCIDAGDPNYVAGPNETDLDGRPRVIGSRIDMGAYETPIFADARILPRTINLASKGKWITCYIWLPEQYNVTDIDPNSVLLEDEIKANKFSVDEQQQVATARFYRSDVQTIINVGETELSITGRLTDGTVFEATDIIRVIDKRDKK